MQGYDFEKVGYQVQTVYNRVTVEYKIFAAPPGVKYVHVFWDADHMDRGFQRFTFREGKARRDDNDLWDLRGEFTRTLPKVTEPITRRMRINPHIEGLTGGCGRGRDYTLTPVPSAPPPPKDPGPAPSLDPIVNSIMQRQRSVGPPWRIHTHPAQGNRTDHAAYTVKAGTQPAPIDAPH